MDEVLFHLSQRLETFQLWMSALVSRTAEAIEARLASEEVARLQEAAALAWIRLLDRCAALSAQAVAAAQPQLLIAKITSIIGPDLNRATLWAGCVGFTLGGSLGIVLGVCLQSPQPPQTTMKAIAALSFTGVDGIGLIEDAVIPTLSRPDDVLIEVKCASLDQLDLKVASGYARALRKQLSKYNPNWRGELPVILGREGSGVVVEVGRGVSWLEVGDSVYFTSPAWGPGTLAQYVLLNAKYVARKPCRVGFEGAASLGYSGCVAWEAVVKRAGLTTRNAHTKRVVVLGGTGGGWMVAQLAANLGAQVTVTCLNRAAPIMRTLGAAHTISLESPDAESSLLHSTKFDLVVNTGGGACAELSAGLVAPSGVVATTVVSPLPSDTFGIFLGSLYSLWIRITHGIFGAESWATVSLDRSVLEELARMVDANRLQPLVDRVYPPQDIDAAIRHLDSHNAIGKTVIRFSGGGGTSKRERVDRPDLLS